jgi:tape measure domain-containing protein
VALAYQLLVRAKGDSSQLQREFRTAERAVEKTGRKMQDVGRMLTRRLTLPIVGIATAVAGLTLKGGISRALNIEDAKAKLRGLGHDMKAIDRIMDSALASVKGTAYGLDSAATAAASAVAAGIDPGKELTRVLSLTADTATITGRSFEEAGSIVNKVLASNRVSMEEVNQLQDAGLPILQMLADQYGVNAGAMRDMVSSGVVGSAEFLTAIETNIAGAALESGNTTRGALANMGAAFSRLGEKFIEPLLPTVRELLGSFTAWADRMTKKAEPAAKRLSGIVKSMLAWFQGLSDSGRRNVGMLVLFAAAIGPLLTMLGTAIIALKGVFAALAVLGAPMYLVIAAVAALAVGMVVLYKRHEGFRNFIHKRFIPALKNIWDWIKVKVPQAVAYLRRQWAAFWPWAKKNLGPIIDIVRRLAVVYLKMAWTYLQTLWAIAKPILKALWWAFRPILNRLKDIVKEGIEKLQPVFTWIRDKGVPIIENMADKFTKIKDAVGKMVDGLRWVKNNVADIVGKIPGVGGGDGWGDGAAVGPLAGVDSFTPIAQRFGLVVSPGGAHRPGDPGYHGQNRARDYSNGFGPTPEMLRFAGMMAMIYGRQLKELIYTPLGYGIKNGQRVPLEFWGDRVNQMHNNHVHVAYARGGIVTRPHIGLVGEAGPEAIIPLGSSRQARADRDRLVRQSGLGGGGGDIHVHGITDPVEAASVVARKQRMMRGAVSY